MGPDPFSALTETFDRWPGIKRIYRIGRISAKKGDVLAAFFPGWLRFVKRVGSAFLGQSKAGRRRVDDGMTVCGAYFHQPWSLASSQTGSFGQDVRHASMVSW